LVDPSKDCNGATGCTKDGVNNSESTHNPISKGSKKIGIDDG
jgi:hypothetical protein